MGKETEAKVDVNRKERKVKGESGRKKKGKES